MLCDICGSKEATARALIEGTEMSVCSGCSSFGKVVSAIRHEQPTKNKKTAVEHEQKPLVKGRGELVQMIIPDYGSIIKNRREKLGIKQEDAAKKLCIKESLLHKIETGAFEPNIELARKLEKFFGVKLVEQVEEQRMAAAKTDSEEFTIGDFIKVKGK
jgi:putative transcription factor